MILTDKTTIDISPSAVLNEKIKFNHISSLSDCELLAIVVGRGEIKTDNELKKADKLLSESENLHDLFTKINSGKIGSTALLAAVAELVRRFAPEKNDDSSKIVTNIDVENLMRPLIGSLKHEEFWVISLNSAQRVIDKRKISSGGVDCVAVDVKLLMRHVIQNLASSIIIVHNHPSGTLTPTESDIELTRKIDAASTLLDILLLDHIIIGRSGSASLRELKLL